MRVTAILAMLLMVLSGWSTDSLAGDPPGKPSRKISPPPVTEAEILAATIEQTNHLHRIQVESALSLLAFIDAGHARWKGSRLATVEERSQTIQRGPDEQLVFQDEAERQSALASLNRRRGEVLAQIEALERGEVAIPRVQANTIGGPIRMVRQAPNRFMRVAESLEDGRIVVEQLRKAAPDEGPNATDRLESVWLVENPPKELRVQGHTFETFPSPVWKMPTVARIEGSKPSETLVRVAFIDGAMTTEAYAAAKAERGKRFAEGRAAGGT